MSSSSTHYSSGDASHSSSSSHSNTLPIRGNNIKEHEDTLSNPKDILSQPEKLTMTNTDRSKYRNVHIFNASDRNTTIGGLILTDGVTNANFYAMVEIIVIAICDFTLRNESDVIIEKDSSPLQPGNYYIHASQPFDLSNELLLSRALSLQTGTRVQAFRDANGLLLRSDMHQLFDFYDFSINPDDDYKIVCFSRDRNHIAGKFLDQRLLDDPQRPVDQLLRWHFRQAVLTNMKGAGEPIFEHDFPPGSDIVGNILEGPKAAERMEFELFSRLATQFDLTK
ncbi:hypothetical protein EG329_006132 [Mollisiaceae sp. DMI_Dod_QoI]|nr:hypothetical protein EG329_006132 [Helotiales sp. DMI_Dod_QoI]